MPAGLEPVVVAWESGNRTVLWPDQGFLMTYGLIPRQVSRDGDDEIRWDDPTFPRHDIVVVRPVSTYDFPEVSDARVTISRDYLQDYATLRRCSLIQVYFEERWGDLRREDEAIMGSAEFREFKLEGRLIRLRILKHNDPPALAQVWGVRPLVHPGDAPISAGRWDYGALSWPGFEEPVTREVALALYMREEAYVRDSVLADYEGRPGFIVNAESGGVCYRNQWAVGYCARIGRDLIAVELKKLYEGNPPEVVKHWHQHAVDPPTGDRQSLMAQLNVGTRARRVTYGLVALGEAIAAMRTRMLGRALSSQEVVGLRRDALDYEGWYRGKNVEPITRHIPVAMSRDAFLNRCSDLNKLIVEGVSQKLLREILIGLGADRDDIRPFGSLKFLDRLAQLVTVAADTGLDPVRDYQELERRRAAGPPPTPLKSLFQLYDLRTAADHRSNS
ncbi:MAG: hypothetical protein A2148_03515, partial [Chloroflexi bacterium RBG_16_68_14]